MKIAEILRQLADHIDSINELGTEGSSADTTADADELQQNPVMVSPQQQELELAKAALGKHSPVIDKLTQSDNIGEE